jgi:hypothetical protein
MWLKFWWLFVFDVLSRFGPRFVIVFYNYVTAPWPDLLRLRVFCCSATYGSIQAASFGFVIYSETLSFFCWFFAIC